MMFPPFRPYGAIPSVAMLLRLKIDERIHQLGWRQMIPSKSVNLLWTTVRTSRMSSCRVEHR
ncbi:hypothetical protein CHELA1G11_11692 [Hyphomicrobiales bacterium]|nr:hypothetical protein CHELA1G11_11692 [Hyphomicrobiales bacterium]CAH1665986.1 hypothetical protein CHELA1G2_12616 [Hyphomicrobiales bacterium]